MIKLKPRVENENLLYYEMQTCQAVKNRTDEPQLGYTKKNFANAEFTKAFSASFNFAKVK